MEFYLLSDESIPYHVLDRSSFVKDSFDFIYDRLDFWTKRNQPRLAFYSRINRVWYVLFLQYILHFILISSYFLFSGANTLLRHCLETLL